jgi:hypothetical protein
MTEYICVYSFVVGLSILSLTKQLFNYKRIIFINQAIAVTLFTSLRFETGYDWPIYMKNYNDPSKFSFEPSYQLCVNLSKALGLTFYDFFVLFSIFECVLLFLIVWRLSREFSCIVSSILLLVPDFFLIPYFSIVRQSLAFLILVYIISFTRINALSRLALFVIAATFHYSTLVYYAIYSIIAFIRPTKQFLLAILAASSLIYLIPVNLLGYSGSLLSQNLISKFFQYFEIDSYSIPLLARFTYATLFLLLGVLSILNVDHLKGYLVVKRVSPEIAYLSILPFICFLLLPDFPTFTSRFFAFGSIIISLSFALSLFRISNKGLRYRDILSCFLLICLVGFWIKFMSRPLVVAYIPYQSILAVSPENSTGMQRTLEIYSQLNFK